MSAGSTLKTLFTITLTHLMKVQVQMKKFQRAILLGFKNKEKKKRMRQDPGGVRL